MTHPHVPAAFINAIAEEGTKAEAIEFLQKEWNENCALRDALAFVRSDPCFDLLGSVTHDTVTDALGLTNILNNEKNLAAN